MISSSEQAQTGRPEMKVLVACEESQRVCQAFRDLGHEAYSCDILPTSGAHPEWHIQDDIMCHLLDGWDMMIAHPPCTYLCNSGVRWLFDKNQQESMRRWSGMGVAVNLFYQLLDAPISKICVENPIPHSHACLPKYDQIIQPWQFGHGETKATCLWLKNLPKLVPTNIVDGREARVHKMAPGPNRARDRARTYPGIARAMAEQWGGDIRQQAGERDE